MSVGQSAGTRSGNKEYELLGGVCLVGVVTLLLMKLIGSLHWMFHPVFMCSGVVCIGVGYYNFEKTGMRSDKKEVGSDLHWVFRSTRHLHVLCQFLGFIFCGVGFWVMWKSHADNGKSQIAADSDLFSQLHVAFGYVAISGFVVQAIFGLQKYLSFPAKAVRWHGTLGTGVFWCAAAALLVGSFMVGI